MNLAYGLQSGLRGNIYVICKLLLNKISRIFIHIFFNETSNITSFFLPRKVKCCCLSYSAIMKSFFEGRQASFVSISSKVKRPEKCQKEAKTRVEK